MLSEIFNFLAWGLFLIAYPGLSVTIINNKEPDSSFDAFAKQFYDWASNINPESSRLLNFMNGDKLLPLTNEDFVKWHTKTEELMNNLQLFNVSSLDRSKKISYYILNATLVRLNNGYKFRKYGWFNNMNNLEGYHTDIHAWAANRFRTVAELKEYTSRLNLLPKQIEQQMHLMQEAVKLKMTNYITTMDAVPSLLNDITRIKGEVSGYYLPYKAVNDSVKKLWNFEEYSKSALKAIEKIYVRLRYLSVFLQQVYFPATRPSPSVLSMPGGNEFYLECLRWYLSIPVTSRTPHQIHEIGMSEVKRIYKNMRDILKGQNFNGTIRKFVKKLNNDPLVTFSSKEQILTYIHKLVNKRIWPKISKVFSLRPTTTLYIKETPVDGPVGWYEGPPDQEGNPVGTYYVNLVRPESVKKYSLDTLSLHEAIPGHHFQLSLKYENKNLPKFRRYNFYLGGRGQSVPFEFLDFTANIEGWGLYAEFLGRELGIFEDDFSLFGHYSDEMLRALRLVVDTGLHVKGWTRNETINYMSQYIKDSRKEIEVEVDRYITWPGQALTYKIGELKIKELRQFASERLGDKFDLCQFHSLFLSIGPVPLWVLENTVKDWVDDILRGNDVEYPGCIGTHLSLNENNSNGSEMKLFSFFTFTLITLFEISLF